MPLNSGPGIGGRPGGGGSSFGLPTGRPGGAAGATKTKWVIAEAGGGGSAASSSSIGGGSSSAARGPVTGSCIDILSDPFAWIIAIVASAAVAFLTQDTAEVSSSASQWMYIGASFAGYLCAIFIVGFAVAAFLWAGTKSKAAMQVGFMLVAAFVAAAPLAISKFRNPKSADAAPAVAVITPVEQPVEAPQPVAEQAPVVEQPARPIAEPEPDPEPAPPPRQAPPKAESGKPGTVYSVTEPGLRPRASITPVKKPAPSGVTKSTGTRSAPTKASPKLMNPDLKLVLSEMRNLLSDIKGDATELQEKLKEEGLDSILAPTSFASRTRIDDARRRIANIKRVADSYERTVLARFDAFPDRVRELEIGDELKEAAVRSFEKNRAESLKKLREIAQLDRAILSEADKLFAFMDTRLGKFRVGERIVFQDADDAETYNRHVERLQELAAKEERAVVENQKAALSRLAAIERELLAAQP